MEKKTIKVSALVHYYVEREIEVSAEDEVSALEEAKAELEKEYEGGTVDIIEW